MKKKRNFVIILMLVLILTVFWVIFNVYHNYVNSTISDPLSVQIIPIEGKFDDETIEQIKTRIRIEPNFELEIASIASKSTPTPTPSIEAKTNEGTKSATTSPTPIKSNNP